MSVFETVIAVYEYLLNRYDNGNSSANSAPGNQLPTNLGAAGAEIEAYYTNLDDSPV